jgi:capsular polysaccharide biosynthesis protein
MIKIKKLFQKSFKILFQALFKLIYGKINYTQNNLISPNILIHEIINKNIKKFNLENYKIYKIVNGRIYTDNVENVAIIDKKNIIDNVSYQQVNGNLLSASNNICLQKGTPKIKKKFSGRVLCLAQGASGIANYYHWLFDLLPKIKLYSEIFNLNDLNYLYSGNLKKFQRETLEPLNLQNLKIIDSLKYNHIQADEIICTDHTNYYTGYIENESKKIPEWIIKWLRDIYLNCAKKFNCNDKIYIDRSSSKSKHCQFINHHEILEFLKLKGFSSYKTEELSFFEEIYLFKNAKFIIGAHGAGFANLAFCNKLTKVIEIRPENRTNSLYKRISDINNLDYQLILTDILDPKIKNNGDIKIDINLLKKYL